MHHSLVDKGSFSGLDRSAWFFSGAESPPYRGAENAVNQYLANRSLAGVGRDRNERTADSLKRNLAALLQAEADQIALVSNSSEAISQIAAALQLQPGDNVVINTLEFPSGVLPWLLHADGGVEVRTVEHRDWEVPVEEILARVDGRTRVVMTSHVSYMSGARLDYQRLYANLKGTGTLLLLDATQSLGVVPVDVNHADIVVCSSYKWLLGLHGLGILALNPARTGDLMPRFAGWRSVAEMFGPDRFSSFQPFPDARRFELGYPNFPTIYAMEASTRLLLEVGIEKIEQHVLTLGGLLMQRLLELDFEVMTPADPQRRAGNIAAVCREGARIAEALQAEGIYLWGGDGRFRASVHLFNDSADVDRLMEALKRIK